jgi:hypothetical protein
MDLRRIPLFLAFFLLLSLSGLAQSNSGGNDQGEGPLKSVQPNGITPEEVIRRFAAREKDFAQARENYTYRQTVKVETLDGDTVDGEYDQVVDVLFDDKGKRRENVLFSPQSSLQRVTMTRDDFEDIQHRYPFVLTTDEIPEYQILYQGQQREDELNTYVFDIAPKTFEKGKRYFQGRIWVDDHDFQIVKTHGKPVGAVSTAGQQFPAFTTYREQIDNKYWFPTYTFADEVLHFPGGKGQLPQDVRIRIKVKYTDYKRFASNTKILYGDEELKKAPQDQQQPNPPKK